MRIYRGKIKPISEDIVTNLVSEGDIEVAEEQVPEVVLDSGPVQAVLAADSLCALRRLVVKDAGNLFGDGRSADLQVVDEGGAVYL